VGHRRGSLLAAPERLGQLPHLRALGSPYLQRYLLDSGSEDGERSEDLGVAVALHDLGGGGGRSYAQLLASYSFDFRVHVRVDADGAGDLAYRGDLPGVSQPLQVALHLEGPDREPVPEHRRLGVNPVRPPDHDRVAMVQGHLAEQEGQPSGVRCDQVERLSQLQGAGGVHHVGARQAEVEVSGDGAVHGLRDGRDEGYDVVVRLLLYLADPLYREAGSLGELFDLLGGDLA
jgi:hypothetical protein